MSAGKPVCGACGFGSVKRKRIARSKKSRKSKTGKRRFGNNGRKASIRGKPSSRSMFGRKRSYAKYAKHGKAKKHGKKKMNVHKFGKISQLNTMMGNTAPNTMSTSQIYTGNSPGQYADHLTSIPLSLRSNFYTDI